MKYDFKFITLFCIFTFFSSVLLANNSGSFVLVIDPGHGGKDSGATGAKSKEKDLNLSVARLFGELVAAKHPDVKVVYTRKTDKFVDLKDRANLANKEKADLFISIHTNSAKSQTPYGAETYTLGQERSEDNLEVAKRENSVILLEEDYKQKYEGFDPKSSESYIIFEFITNKYMEQSVSFASMIQKEFKNTSKRTDRGVRQAGFLMLRATSMPSVLVELGFICNPKEEAFLISTSGQQSLANSLFNAFTRYKNDYDRKTGGNRVATPASKAPASSQTSAPVKTPAPSQVPVVSQDTVSSPQDTVITPQKGEVVYKLQIVASSTPIPPNSPSLKGYKASSYVENGMYKYTYGNTTDINEIIQLKTTLIKDFPDAFIVRFVDGKRIK